MANRYQYPPMLDPTLALLLGGGSRAPTDEDLGVPSLELQSLPAAYRTDPRLASLLGGLSGLGGAVTRAPRSFGEGLAGGFATGLGGAAQRVAAEQDRLETLAEQRRREINAQNVAATQAYRTERAAALRERTTATERRAEKQTEYERDNPLVTPELVQRFPQLGRLPAGARISRSTLEKLTTEKPEKPEKERLVAIQTPTGPKYVRESEALGQPPAAPTGALGGKPPSATERDELVNDVTTLEQTNRIANLYHPSFVGPVSGRRGAVSTTLGTPEGLVFIGSRKGEADFKAALASYRNAVIKQLSGAAVSKSEAARMRQQIPAETNPSQVFEARLRQTERNLRTIAERRREYYISTGLDLSKLPALPPAPGSAEARARPPLEAFVRP